MKVHGTAMTAAVAGLAIGLMLVPGSGEAAPGAPPLKIAAVDPGIDLINHRRKARKPFWYLQTEETPRFWYMQDPFVFEEPRYVDPEWDIRRPTGKRSRSKEARKRKEPAAPSKQATAETKKQVVARTKKKASPTKKRITCEAGAEIVAGYAFSSVTPQTCSGGTYTFQAMRENRPYTVELSARTGELIRVVKGAQTASR
jgi:hypothetical protein